MQFMFTTALGLRHLVILSGILPAALEAATTMRPCLHVGKYDHRHLGGFRTWISGQNLTSSLRRCANVHRWLVGWLVGSYTVSVRT